MSVPRIGVIGAGDWAGRMHLPAMQTLARAGRAVYPAVCDLHADRARALAAGLSAEQVCTDPLRMLVDCRPDAVVILVEPAAAGAMVLLAAEHGVPFLVEKPPAPDSATHRRLIEAVGPLTHLVAYNRRHAPYVLAARQWLAGATRQSVTALFSRHRRHDPDFSTTAVHAIDTARFLAGEPFAELRLDVVPAGPVVNRFVTGWTHCGCWLDVQITPDTASSGERYVIQSADRGAAVLFPQGLMHGVGSYVELHEDNRVARRLGPADFGLSADDAPALIGILGEHERFLDALAGRAASESTLADTLQTQQVRDELIRLERAGGRQSGVITF